MKLTPTAHTVDIEGEVVQVKQGDNGRLHATDSQGRKWNAKTLDILKQRIALTLEHSLKGLPCTSSTS